MTSDNLTGRRIMVAEDETLIALEIEDVLLRLGCLVVGPVAKLDAAVRLAREEEIDAAILDVNIRGGPIYPAAELLLSRGIPFVLASGYGNWALPEWLQGHPRLTKPFSNRDVAEEVARLCLREDRRSMR